jgi:hypothetical protein
MYRIAFTNKSTKNCIVYDEDTSTLAYHSNCSDKLHNYHEDNNLIKSTSETFGTFWIMHEDGVESSFHHENDMDEDDSRYHTIWDNQKGYNIDVRGDIMLGNVYVSKYFINIGWLVYYDNHHYKYNTCVIDRKEKRKYTFIVSNLSADDSFMGIDMENRPHICGPDIIYNSKLIDPRNHEDFTNYPKVGTHLIMSDVGFIYINEADATQSSLVKSTLSYRHIIHNGILYDNVKFIAPNMQYRNIVHNLISRYLYRDTVNIVLDYMHNFNTI